MTEYKLFDSYLKQKLFTNNYMETSYRTVSEFDLQSRNYARFRINILWKVMRSYIRPAMG